MCAYSCCQGSNLKHRSVCMKGEESLSLILSAMNSNALLSWVGLLLLSALVVNLFCVRFCSVVNGMTT